MSSLLAFVCFVIATVIFALVALEKALSLPWGFVFVGAGLALLALGPAYVASRSRLDGS